jgi:hypothetical protein
MGDGHIELKGTTADWLPHFLFDDRQLLPDGNDTDCCWDFSNNKIFDALMDALMPTLPTDVQQRIAAMGFMDVSSVDNSPHFHSSDRLIAVLSGALQNGGTIPEWWQWAQKVGVVPYAMLPDTQTLSQWDATNIPQNVLEVGTQFLALMGGKDFLQYHWVNDGGATDIAAMAAALPTAPLALGIPVNDAGWNQTCPTIATGAPVHVVAAYAIDGTTVLVKDNYAPYFKELLPGYQISYALQPVIRYVPPPPPAPLPPDPTFPASPTPAQVSLWQSWLAALKQWILGIESEGKM